MIRLLPVLLVVTSSLANSTSNLMADEKATVPEAELSRSLADVQALFGDKFTEAKKIRSLAERSKALGALVDEILETHENTIKLADRYALLQVARQIAVHGQDFDTALVVIDTADKSFQIDAVAMKASALVKISGKLRSVNRHAEIIPSFISVLNDVIQAERYEIAETLSDAAMTSARQARDKRLLKQIRTRVDAAEEAATEFRSYQQAISLLTKVPDDPEANLAAGKYLCIYRGDWAAGVSYLVLGADEQLREVAKADLAETNQPTADAAQLEVADGWWTVADAAKDAEQMAFRDRARDWYKKVLPSLQKGGLVHRRVQDRLREHEAVLQDELPKFAKAFIGRYVYQATSKNSDESLRAIWEFRDDNKVLENANPIAVWAVTDRNRIRIDLEKADEEPIFVTPRNTQPISGSRKSNGNTWRWKLIRLEAQRWEHTIESIEVFGREIDGDTEILTFYSNGRINDPLGEITWTRDGENLTIDWGNSKTTEAKMGRGGTTYSGKTRQPTGFRGTRISLPVTGRLIVDDDMEDSR